MKARMIALLWVVAAAAVWAQSAPPSQKVASEGKTAASKPAMSQAKPAVATAKPAAAKPVAAKPAAVSAKPAAASPMKPKPAAARAVKPAAAKPAGAEVKKAAIKTASAVKPAIAKRDPFVSPIREQTITGPNCSTGKKCLAINAMVLRGIVKSQVGMIAVVESATRKISLLPARERSGIQRLRGEDHV